MTNIYSKASQSDNNEALPVSYLADKSTLTTTGSISIMSLSYTDHEYISSFLRNFNADRAWLQTFKDGGGADHSLTSMQACGLDRLPLDKLQVLNQQGAGVFFAVNSFKGDKRDSDTATFINAFFVDMDGKEPDPAGLAKLPGPSIVVQSKNGKHLYWLLQEPIAVTDIVEAKKLFKGYQTSLAALLGGDTKVNDLARLMRLPGFNHMKDPTDPFEVAVIKTSTIKYNLVDFPVPSLAEAKPVTQNLLSALDKIEARVLAAKSGDRNVVLNKEAFEASGLVKKGLDYDLAFDTLVAAAVYIGLEKSEAMLTVESGLKSGIQKRVKTSKEKPTYADVVALLTEAYKDRILFNEATGRFELDGKTTTFSNIVHDIRIEYPKVNKQDALDFTEYAGDNFRYHPVRQYIKKLPTVATYELFPQLAKKLFGVEDELSAAYIQRWLIAAIARVVDPGCQMDTALVIKGDQGIGKTSLFRALAKNAWFTTLGSTDKGKDELMKLSQFWLVEYGEIESAFRRKDVADMKAFLSETRDAYRKPYGKDTITYDRSCVFCGTTNEDAFLSDDTGNRRFWVIDAGQHKIDTKWVEQNVDAIWAEAKTAYLSGTRWHLNDLEQGLANKANEKYTAIDTWEEVIELKLNRILTSQGKIAFTTGQMLQILFAITPERANKGHSNKVAKILRQKGFALQQKRTQYGTGKYWFSQNWDHLDESIEILDEMQFSRLTERYSQCAT